MSAQTESIIACDLATVINSAGDFAIKSARLSRNSDQQQAIYNISALMSWCAGRLQQGAGACEPDRVARIREAFEQLCSK